MCLIGIWCAGCAFFMVNSSFKFCNSGLAACVFGYQVIVLLKNGRTGLRWNALELLGAQLAPHYII